MVRLRALAVAGFFLVLLVATGHARPSSSSSSSQSSSSPSSSSSSSSSSRQNARDGAGSTIYSSSEFSTKEKCKSSVAGFDFKLMSGRAPMANPALSFCKQHARKTCCTANNTNVAIRNVQLFFEQDSELVERGSPEYSAAVAAGLTTPQQGKSGQQHEQTKARASSSSSSSSASSSFAIPSLATSPEPSEYVPTAEGDLIKYQFRFSPACRSRLIVGSIVSGEYNSMPVSCFSESGRATITMLVLAFSCLNHVSICEST